MEMLTIRQTPPNRNYKRQAEAEFNKIFELLWNVELRFYKDLFLTEKSYDEVYLTHHNNYQKDCEYIAKAVKPKWFTINKEYFSNQFKPIEKI